MTPHEILVNARALIEEPAKWGQGSCYLRKGTLCAEEAIETIASNKYEREAALSKLNEAAGNEYVFFNSFNDTHTHAEVLAAFDKAIALAKEEQGP